MNVHHNMTMNGMKESKVRMDKCNGCEEWLKLECDCVSCLEEFRRLHDVRR